MSYLVGIDIGGTFTDIVLMSADGRFRTKKISSSVDNYARAIAEGLAEALVEHAIPAAAIAELPPRCREILVLRKFENLSHREIAQKLGLSVHTVEAQLTKALHRCEEFFARHGLP